jgi:hypothetical protein
MASKFRIQLVESERGWGQDYWTEDFDTAELAQERIDYVNSFNTADEVPDYYIRAFDKIEVVQV